MAKIKAPLNWTKHLLPAHPIVYVTTVSDGGIDNCAVFATCEDTSYNPPQVSFASSIKQHRVIDFPHGKIEESVIQDTLSNIRNNGRFIVNVPGINLARHMKELSYPYPPEIDETEKAGLTKRSAPNFSLGRPCPKIIEECLAHLECELVSYGIFRPRKSDHYLVTGRVIGVSYDSLLGSELDEIKRNLVSQVFFQIGASPKPNTRYIGRMTLEELPDTLIFESERNSFAKH